MKKKIFFALLTGSVLLFMSILIVGYYYVYPRMVAEAIVSKKYTSIIPMQYRDQFNSISDTINVRVSKMMQFSEEKGITIDDLLLAIDEIKEDDVRDALNELNETDLKSIEHVYMIGRKHIDFKAFDPDLLKSAFLEHVKMHHVERGLKYIKKHDLENQLDAPSGRRIAKQIIIQKKDKIMKKSVVKE